MTPIARSSLEKMTVQAQRAADLYRGGLTRGVFVAGEESACTIESIRHLMDMLHDLGMGVELHAGAW